MKELNLKNLRATLLGDDSNNGKDFLPEYLPENDVNQSKGGWFGSLVRYRKKEQISFFVKSNVPQKFFFGC
jgi:hypothetical protein